MRRMFVAGNWKMNGSLDSIKSLLAGIKSGLGSAAPACDIAVCPPAIYIPTVAEQISGSALELGGQNVCDQEKGAYTGEVAASMLVEFGCKYAIVGHSERRSVYGESSDLVARRFAGAQQGGLIPILCVGEQLEEREAGKTEAVVSEQLQAVIDLTGVGSFAKAVIAYEPVWAIGTGKTASPDQAQQVHAFIRNKLAGLDAAIAKNVVIQYGGSVNAANAKELFSMEDIDGGLIGGASLKADDFLAICQATS